MPLILNCFLEEFPFDDSLKREIDTFILTTEVSKSKNPFALRF